MRQQAPVANQRLYCCNITYIIQSSVYLLFLPTSHETLSRSLKLYLLLSPCLNHLIFVLFDGSLTLGALDVRVHLLHRVVMTVREKHTVKPYQALQKSAIK